MRKAIVFASIMFFVAGSALATSGGDIDIDNSNDNRSSSSSTSNPTQNFTPHNTNTNTANGGAGGQGGHGGVGFGGDVDFDSDIRNSQGQGQDQDQAQGQHQGQGQSQVGVNAQSQDASNKGNKQNVNVDASQHDVRQAPATFLSVGQATEGLAFSGPGFGGSLGGLSRFSMLQASAILKIQAAQAGVDISEELVEMKWEAQETRFLGVLPIPTPYNVGQSKSVFRSIGRAFGIGGGGKKTKDSTISGNAGNLSGGVQS